MATIDRALVEGIIREALTDMGLAEQVKQGKAPKGGSAAPAAQGRSEALPSPFEGELQYERPQRIFDEETIARLKSLTPARLAQGRTGTRYLTSTYIGLRADHAVALDAVQSEVPADWAAKHGCIPLQTRAKDKQEYLLYPDQGRRLDEPSIAKLLAEGTKSSDVQLILSDGLAAWGVLENGKELLAALQAEISRAGFKLGRPLFVKYGRIGVQDEIGTLLGCKSTVICVGERPGLGTGNSLSIYTAYGPKLGQDNADKDCISNVRGMGIPPKAAAKETADLLLRSFKAGGGGTHLVRSGQ